MANEKKIELLRSSVAELVACLKVCCPEGFKDGEQAIRVAENTLKMTE